MFEWYKNMKKTRSNIILCSDSIYRKKVVGTDVGVGDGDGDGDGVDSSNNIDVSNVLHCVKTSNTPDIPDISMSMKEHYVFDTMDLDIDIELELDIVKKEEICELCCLCGCNTKEHHIKRHKFIPLHENYRCQVCSLFFYQHDHSKNPCFRPKKYIY